MMRSGNTQCDFFSPRRPKQTARFQPRSKLNFLCYDSRSEYESESSDFESIISDCESRPVAEPVPDMPDAPLENSWDVYFLRNDVSDWDERLEFIFTFSTVKEFWAIYQHIKLPSHLPQGCDYMIMRHGIAPRWETPENLLGGRWMCELDRMYRNEQLDSKWLETLLALIGEQLDQSGGDTRVNGAVVQSRKKIDRISLWVNDCENDQETRSMGFKYQKLINADSLKFQTHESNANRMSSMMRYKHVIHAESY